MDLEEMTPEDRRILGIIVPRDHREMSIDEIRLMLEDEIAYDEERGLKFKDRRKPEKAIEAPKITAAKGGRCPIPTAKGNKCPINPEPGRPACHVHDPEGKYAKQNPKYRKKMLTAFADLGITLW